MERNVYTPEAFIILRDMLVPESPIVAVAQSGQGLAGTIPPEFGNISNLLLLDLAGNALAGTIPDSFGSLGSLQALKLANNALTGSIPASVRLLAGLSYANATFSGNPNFADCGLKDVAAECQALLALKAASSSGLWAGLAGTTVCSGWAGVTCTAGRVSQLSLASRGLSGTLPPALGSLASLTALDLRSNAFSGTIPASLSSLTALRALYLDTNSLSGSVPAAVRAALGGGVIPQTSASLFNNSGLTDCALSD